MATARKGDIQRVGQTSSCRSTVLPRIDKTLQTGERGLRFTCEGKKSLTVPDHKVIGRGLMKKILRDAELSVEESASFRDLGLSTRFTAPANGERMVLNFSLNAESWPYFTKELTKFGGGGKGGANSTALSGLLGPAVDLQARRD